MSYGHDNGGYYNWNYGGDQDYGPAGVYGTDPQVDPFQNDPFENDRKRREEAERRRQMGEPEEEDATKEDPEDKSLTVKGTFVEFAETTTLHGVPRLVSTESPWPFLWTVIVLVVTAVFFYLFSTLIIRYFSYPVNVANKVIYREVEFPAVSICNINNLRLSAVKEDKNIWLAMQAFEDNLQSQLQGSLDTLEPATRRRKRREAPTETLEARRERRKKRQTCGGMGCPSPRSRVGFWPFTKKYEGYDRSGFDNKAFLNQITYIDGPTNLTDGAAFFDDHHLSYVQIANNGALDVKGSFTWVGYVNLYNISIDTPLWVWMPNPDGYKAYASGLVARMRDGILTLHMSLVDMDKDIAGVYALGAKLKLHEWHLVAVGFDAPNGQLHFRIDEYNEVKEHIGWVNETHDTMTEVKIGTYGENGPRYLSEGAMHGAMSCVQIFNYYVEVTNLTNLIDLQPCECVNNTCVEPTTLPPTTAIPNFTTTAFPEDAEIPLVDLTDAVFVPEVEEKPWFDPGSPAAAVENAQNFSRLLRDIQLPIRREMGHQLDTLLQTCTYDEQLCTPLNFSGFTNGKYGNCYTFNGPTVSSNNASKPGSLYGLVLTLYIEQHEYISALTSAAGVRVLVHLPNVQPFPEDSDGIDVMPGRKTSISVKKRDYIKLGGHYSDCTDGSQVDLLYANVNYSDGACFRSCRQRQTIDDCGCGEASLPLVDDYKHCSTDDDIACAQDVKDKYEQEIYVCQCPDICEKSIFVTSVATSEWPGKAFEKTIIEEFKQRDESLATILEQDGNFQKNFLKLEVFYDDIMYELIEETPAYPSPSLLADIGGQLGLWLGLSILTLVEIVQLFVDLATLCCRRKRTVRPG